jgi:hypothetical protein
MYNETEGLCFSGESTEQKSRELPLKNLRMQRRRQARSGQARPLTLAGQNCSQPSQNDPTQAVMKTTPVPCFVLISTAQQPLMNQGPLYILFLCSVYSVFVVPTGILRSPWLRFYRAFSSVVRQMPGYTSQRRGIVRNLSN